MTTRHRARSPHLAASLAAGRGPAVRAVVQIRLPARYDFVSTPQPTAEHGGLDAYPTGTIVRLDIGNARHCDELTAAKIAGAIRACAEIEVVGTDWRGVAETRAALSRALNAGVSPAC